VKKKHFVTFYSPGTMFSEENEVEIESWDACKATKMANDITQRHGAKPYGFKFSTKLITDLVVDGEEFEVKPKTVKSSGIHYITGGIRTAEEILRGTDPKEDVLRTNVKCNEIPAIIENCNSYKATMPFYKEDILLDKDGNVVLRGSDF